MKFLLLMLLVTTMGCAAPKMTHGIPNLQPVIGAAPNLWRGGQPTMSGWDWLKAQGVTDVLKLNPRSEGSDDYATSIGLKVHYYPITTGQQLPFGHPDPENVSIAVGLISTNWAIHCTHGQDRTGEIIGVYRVTRCGWSKEKAYREMLDNGFHPMLLGLTHFWKDYVYEPNQYPHRD